jgi:FtsZ-binding cell division protein ZapB
MAFLKIIGSICYTLGQLTGLDFFHSINHQIENLDNKKQSIEHKIQEKKAYAKNLKDRSNDLKNHNSNKDKNNAA